MAPSSVGRWQAQADVAFRHMPSIEYAWALAQDGAGFIWAGIDTGLVRWDGFQKKTYVADAQNARAMPAGQATSLYVDPAGTLWVGTSIGGIARYDPGRDEFVAYGRGPAGLQDPNVAEIAGDGHGGLWVGTGSGLEHLDPASGAVRHTPLGDGRSGAVSAIVQNTDGTLWLGTEQGLLRRAAGDDRFVSVPLGARADRPTPVAKLCRDHAGRLWIGTVHDGLFVVEPGNAAPRAILEHGGSSTPVDERISAIVDAGPGGVWAAALGGGVIVIAPDAGFRTQRIRHRMNTTTSLPDDDVSALLVDRSGVVWASTPLGLSTHNARSRGVWTLFGAKTRDRPITGVQVHAILSHADGRVWVSAGDGGGVDILDPVAGRVGELRPDPKRPHSALPMGRVVAMAATPSGGVFLGSLQGLYLADGQGRDVSRIDIPQRAADLRVDALAVSDGVVWIGGADGLWALTAQPGGPPTLLRHLPAEHFGNRRISAILRGAGNTLWVGTATGLSRVDVRSGAVERLPDDAADRHAFASGYVTSLLLDGRGRLWVGTAGVGIQVMEGVDAAHRLRFRRIDERDGLPNLNMDALLSDARGRIWASTDAGLVVIDATTYTLHTLGEPQGVPITGYWANAGARTPVGELLFGGVGGMTIVDPEQETPAADTPPMAVTEVRVGTQAIIASQFNGAGAVRRLVVPAGTRDLSVEFAALDFVAPELNRYSYRLKGYDRDWIATVASRRLATYTNLLPGDYTLQLRGTGPLEGSKPTVFELSVHVPPQWYETNWARLALLLLGACGVWGVVQLRTRYLRRRQRELHVLVALRTEELEASQRQLEQIAYCDPLTGLPNRRRFNEDLRGLLELALRGTISWTLLLIDLDRFKQINDTLGHDAGDALLIDVGKRLTAALRKCDRVARLGGDEFAVLMAGGNDGQAVETVCARIIASVARPVEHAGHTLQVSASIGAANCPLHAADADALYKRADLALYAAKRAGRNTWRLSDADAAAVSTTPIVVAMP